MTPERWRQVEELYNAALERAPDERASLLAQSDPHPRRAVEERLANPPTFDLVTPAPISPYDRTSTAAIVPRDGSIAISDRSNSGARPLAEDAPGPLRQL